MTERTDRVMRKFEAEIASTMRWMWVSGFCAAAGLALIIWAFFG